MLKTLFILQVSLSLVFAFLIYFVAGKTESFSFLCGALFAVLNSMFLVFVVVRLFRKKSVAPTLLLIIFKYTIFGLSLYFLVTSKYLLVSWFVVGLSILLPSIGALIVLYWKQLNADRSGNQGDKNFKP